MSSSAKITISVTWGNADASATLVVSPARWRRICDGKSVCASAWSHYEGSRQRVGFTFNVPNPGDLFVGGEDGEEHFIGRIGEAEITGASYASKPAHATEFLVHDGSTLAMAGIEPPSTRAEAYDLAPDRLTEADDLLTTAEDCPPFAWLLHREYDGTRDELASAIAIPDTPPQQRARQAAALAAMPADPEAGLSDWLASRTKAQLRPLLRTVRRWLNQAPDWSQEDDYLPAHTSAQGAALHFFHAMPPADRAALGIVIVEGEHPGSSYYAAELHNDPATANQTAIKRGLGVWFTATQRCAGD
jgi:hypothetical protein